MRVKNSSSNISREGFAVSDEASMVVTIRADGTVSMKVTVTELAKKIGVKVGDQVRITMKKID